MSVQFGGAKAPLKIKPSFDINPFFKGVTVPMSSPSSKLLLGELIGTVTADKNGLMPAGLFVFENININKNQPLKLSPVNGVMFVQNVYSYGGYVMYMVTFNEVKEVCNPAGYSIGLNIQITDAGKKEVTISTTSEDNRQIRVIYQNLPV